MNNDKKFFLGMAIFCVSVLIAGCVLFWWSLCAGTVTTITALAAFQVVGAIAFGVESGIRWWNIVAEEHRKAELDRKYPVFTLRPVDNGDHHRSPFID